jgi:hypothetical protein
MTPLYTFDQWNAAALGERAALLSRKLGEVSPGWGSTELGSALTEAAEALADSSGNNQDKRARIELITDLQEGSRLEQLQGYEWPKGLVVSINVLKPRSNNNASLQLVSDDETSGPKNSGNLRVRVTNVAGSKREQFKLGWGVSQQAGFSGKPIDVYVPAGQSRVVEVPIASAAAGGSPDRILLQGDDDEFDNTIFARPPEPIRLSVTYLGNDSESNPKQALFFLERAFQETRRQTVRVTAHRPADLIPAAEAQASCLFVVAAPLSNETASALRDLANAGKTILIIPDRPEMKATVRQLLEAEKLTWEDVRPGNYAMLGEIDFRNPIFAPFADPRFSDFTKIHFWRYVRLDGADIPTARAVARFDSGDPALLEVPRGSGRILILTSSWQPEASQLALSSKFVPLLYSILESSGAPAPVPAQYRVGDVVPLASLDSAHKAGAIVSLPDGSQQTLSEEQKEFSQTDLPGIYSVAKDGATRHFVVNLDPAESRIMPLPVDELERLGVPSIQPIDTSPIEKVRKTRLQNVELENRQKLWRWFLSLTLLVLLLETWLAGRTARRLAAAPLSVAPV